MQVGLSQRMKAQCVNIIARSRCSCRVDTDAVDINGVGTNESHRWSSQRSFMTRVSEMPSIGSVRQGASVRTNTEPT